jgi:two-component system sensor kinase FixL
MSTDDPRSAQPELQSLLDATVDAVILIDARGTVETFNRAGERLFGYTPDEVIGRNVSMLMTSTDRDAHDGYMARYMRTSVPHIIGIGREVDARRKDGSEFPVFLSVGRVQGSDPPRFIGLLHDITLRREAMAAIRRERDRANMYLEIAQVILVALSVDHRVQLINRKGCDTLGRRELDLLGRNWLEVAITPGHQEAVLAQYTALGTADGTDEHYFEHEVQGANGPPRLIAWRAIAMRGAEGRLTGFFASGEDITGRRAMEQSMERARILLDEAQDLARIGNFEVFHPGSGSGFWSPQMSRILGLAGHAAPGLEDYLGIIHPEDRAAHDEIWQEALRGPGTRGAQFRIVTPAGETRHLQATYVSTTAARGDLRIAGVVMDVTAARRAAEETQAAQQRMTQVSRLATMGEMAAGIAHELNQPLAAIANYANAAMRITALADMREVDPDGDVRLALDQISRQALRAGEIIRRLRALVQNRETRLERSAINPLVGEVVGFIRGDARLNEVNVLQDLASGLPEIPLDRIQIQQILLNLLRNAIESVVETRTTEREVHISTALDAEGHLIVEVRDNGGGVPPDIAARIFDPFCTTKESGTGLGLAISRTIAEAHHGRLSYAPASAGGARFILQLPCVTGSPS